jgi:hypothetical protein
MKVEYSRIIWQNTLVLDDGVKIFYIIDVCLIFSINI